MKNFVLKLKELFPFAETFLLVIIVIVIGTLFVPEKKNKEAIGTGLSRLIAKPLRYTVTPSSSVEEDTMIPRFYWIQYIDIHNDTTEFLSTDPIGDCMDSLGKYPINISVVK